jgi:ArsR family transcriptional regulator
MPVGDSVVVPHVAPVTVALEPAQNAIYSLLLLIKAVCTSGFGEWVVATADALTPEERRNHELVMQGFSYAVLPERSWPSFPAYVDHLAKLDPQVLRDKMLTKYAARPLSAAHKGDEQRDGAASTDLAAALEDASSYLTFLRARFSASKLDEELEARAYGYVVDPPAMQALIVTHLRGMWHTYLAPEWARVERMLWDAVGAFRALDVTGMTRLEAARWITGHELSEEKWDLLNRAEQVILVPSAHVGPYLGRLGGGDVLWMFFGARAPAGVQRPAPDLRRAEIVVRLGALADDTRLRILKLVSDEGEKCSREIRSRLELSQSTASRHLKQLNAAGYLCARRHNGAKCYALDAQRVEETLRMVSAFLMGEPRS